MNAALDSAQIGDTLAEYDSGPITRDMLARYAEASGDTNPLHLDPASARKAGFDDVIVHGMLAMALLGRLLTDEFGGSTLRAFDARFVAILAVDQSLHCRARLAARRDGTITLDLDAIDGRGTTIVAGSAVLAASA